MDIVIKILQFVMSFSILVIIHELGHFLFARMFGIKVEKFYLFFNPWFSVFKFKIGETEYGLGWIPFGGYVKIAGMIDESMDTEQMASEPQPYEFRSKPAWQRLLVMIGGVLMNIVLAVCIYIGVSYAWGEEYIANDDLKYGYEFSQLGHELGFQDGDKILSVGGETYDDWLRVYEAVIISDSPEVVVLRDGQQVSVHIKDEHVAKMLESKERLLAPRFPFVAAKVMDNSGAAKAGIVSGDSLVAFNGVPMTFFSEYSKAITSSKGKTVDITVAADSAGVKVLRTYPVAVSEEGAIGIVPYDKDYFFGVHTHEYTFLQSIPVGVKRTGTEIANYWKQLKMIFKPKTGAYKGVGGPIGIYNMFPDTWNWGFFWHITALLSLVLAVFNILPIPALDGGHVLFLLFEVITRRKPNDKFMEYAQWTGLILLLALFVFATGNDISRIVKKSDKASPDTEQVEQTEAAVPEVSEVESVETEQVATEQAEGEE